MELGTRKATTWYFAQHVRDVAPEDMKPPA